MWRRLEIENDITVTGYQGTHRVPIPRERSIGAIEVVVKGVNAANSNSRGTAAEQYDIRRAIEGLTVKSGKRVFYATNGIQNRNIMTYETGRLPWELRTQVGGASQYALFTIPFWVEKMYPNTALPASMLTSLDLEIDYNFVQDSATIGWASTGHQVNVAAWLYDVVEEDPVLAAKQFRVIEQKHDHTSLAAGVSPFTMSQDAMRSMRRIYIEAYKVSVAEGGVISDVQVKRANDEIYASKWTAIQAGNAEDCKLNFIQSMIQEAESTDDEIHTRVPNAFPLSWVPIGTDVYDTEGITAYAAGKITMVNTDETIGYIAWMANEIPTMAVIDWDLLKDLGNMVPMDKKLELMLTNAAVSGEVKIVEESIAKMWV